MRHCAYYLVNFFLRETGEYLLRLMRSLDKLSCLFDRLEVLVAAHDASPRPLALARLYFARSFEGEDSDLLPSSWVPDDNWPRVPPANCAPGVTIPLDSSTC